MAAGGLHPRQHEQRQHPASGEDVGLWAVWMDGGGSTWWTIVCLWFICVYLYENVIMVVFVSLLTRFYHFHHQPLSGYLFPSFYMPLNICSHIFPFLIPSPSPAIWSIVSTFHLWFRREILLRATTTGNPHITIPVILYPTSMPYPRHLLVLLVCDFCWSFWSMFFAFVFFVYLLYCASPP